MITGSPWENGGTPPGEKPVAARTSSGLAGRAEAQSSTRQSASGSMRRAPLAMTTTGSPSATNTIDFAICAAWQPTAAAASLTVRVGRSNLVI